MKRWLTPLALVAVVGLLVFLQQRARFTDLAELEEVSGVLADLVNEEHALDENLLRSRHGLEPTYDPLNNSVQRIQALLSQLDGGPARSFRERHPDFDEAYHDYVRGFEARKVSVERYKSRNSVLRNSVRNFPAAIDPLRDQSPRTADALIVAVQQVELGAGSTWVERADVLRAQLLAELGSDATVALLHSDHILRGGPEVDALISSVLRTSRAERGGRLADVYTAAYLNEAWTAEVYRLLLVATAAGLVLYILFVGVRLWMATTALAKANRALARFGQAAQRFVPQDFLTHLDRSTLSEVELGDHTTRTMSVLFSDIRSFTSLSEGMTPKENFDFINGYLKRMGPVVRRHGGFIDKYIGDAIMALFDVSPDSALNAAVGMLQELRTMNVGRETPIGIGIGIHTGEMVLGTVGEQGRMESTVISDAVNVAARLESLTKEYGVPLLLTEGSVRLLQSPEQFDIRAVDWVRPKGKTKSVRVYEVFDHDLPMVRAQKRLAAPQMHQAVELLAQGREGEALEIYRELGDRYPKDPVVRYHLGRLERFTGAA